MIYSIIYRLPCNSCHSARDWVISGWHTRQSSCSRRPPSPLAEWLGSRFQPSGSWVHTQPSGPVCMYW